MDGLTIGAFGASVILSILLRLIYNTVTVNNKIKPWIAIVLGVALGFLAMCYAGEETTVKIVIDYCLGGFMTGATAVGLYEISQKPKSNNGS